MGLVGANGAGKTTAIRCMLGLIHRDAGDVEIFGETGVEARRLIGAMVETPAFHNGMTGRDCIERAMAFAGQRDGAEVDRVLELVGLRERSEERVATYSLGMRQRLGIARALVGRPRLLLLDEPTNGLDPRGMKEIRDLLSSLAQSEGLTVFISSHLLTEIEALCDRVGIIEDGKMLAEGQVRELLSGRASVKEVDVGVTETEGLAAAISDWDGVSMVGEGVDGRRRLALDGLDVPELTRRLIEAGLGVESIVPVHKSLEDLFLSLTRKELT